MVSVCAENADTKGVGATNLEKRDNVIIDRSPKDLYVVDKGHVYLPKVHNSCREHPTLMLEMHRLTELIL